MTKMMTRMDEIIANLPEFVPGAPPPGELMEATPEQQAQANADRKARSPRRFSAKCERWARERLRKMGAVFYPKWSDALHYRDQDGKRFYQKRGLDYKGIFPGETPLPFALEVKSFCDRFSLASLKPHQQKLLSQARSRGELAIVALVERNQAGRILRGWFVPWRGSDEPVGVIARDLPVIDWETMLLLLREKARVDGRFQGKSIRQQDFNILKSCEVQKTRGRWCMCDWLTIVVESLGQPVLF